MWDKLRTTVNKVKGWFLLHRGQYITEVECSNLVCASFQPNLERTCGGETGRGIRLEAWDEELFLTSRVHHCLCSHSTTITVELWQVYTIVVSTTSDYGVFPGLQTSGFPLEWQMLLPRTLTTKDRKYLLKIQMWGSFVLLSSFVEYCTFVWGALGFSPPRKDYIPVSFVVNFVSVFWLRRSFGVLVESSPLLVLVFSPIQLPPLWC